MLTFMLKKDNRSMLIITMPHSPEKYFDVGDKVLILQPNLPHVKFLLPGRVLLQKLKNVLLTVVWSNWMVFIIDSMQTIFVGFFLKLLR